MNMDRATVTVLSLVVLASCRREPFEPEAPRLVDESMLEASIAYVHTQYGTYGAVVVAPGVLLTSRQVITGPIGETFPVTFVNPEAQETAVLENTAVAHDFAVLRCPRSAERCRSAPPVDLARAEKLGYGSELWSPPTTLTAAGTEWFKRRSRARSRWEASTVESSTSIRRCSLSGASARRCSTEMVASSD